MLEHEPFPTFAKTVGAIDWSRYRICVIGHDGEMDVFCREHGNLGFDTGLDYEFVRAHEVISQHDAEHHATGPWGGVEDLFPEGGVPRSPKQLLKAAQAGGWGFGPITLVYRLNHEAPGVPPFFVCWRYDIAGAKWAFDSARDRTGFQLGIPAIREILPMAAELLAAQQEVKVDA